jgi:hypothetical protein
MRAATPIEILVSVTVVTLGSYDYQTGSAKCSFCGKSQGDVSVLVAGPPPAFICNDCIVLAFEILSTAPGQLRFRVAFWIANFIVKTGYRINPFNWPRR